MADSVEQLYKAQDLQDKLYPITKENAVKDNDNVSLDTKLTSINTSISNKLEAVKINNTALPITDNAVNITIDSEVSETSTNAVQNNVIKSYVDTAKEEVKEDISNSVLENLTSGSSLKLYAQETLAYQEFTYRQSPTQGNGYAKITSIKGNTIVWNQLIRNGNFVDTSNWSAESGATLSISNNIATVSSTTANNGIRQYFPNPLTVGHKYLIKAEFNVPTEYRCVIGTAANQGVQTDKLISTANTWTEVSSIGTCTVATTSFYCFVRGTTYENVKIRNVMCFDLTQMGLDITDPSEFTSLFGKSYYDYCRGAMLSFGGRNVKFNQLVQNGNFASASGWIPTRGTVSASGNVLSYTYTEVAIGAVGNRVQANVGTVSGHSYLLSVDAKLSKAKTVLVLFTSNGTYNVNGTYSANTWKNVHTIVKESSNSTYVGIGFNADSNNVNGDVEQIRNFQVFDLTEMFGAGNEPSVEGFKELFPNDYYEYNVGQYMNLGQPASLKTVSKNQFNTQIVSPSTTVGTTLTKGDGSIRLQYTGTGRYTGFNFMNPNGGLVSDWANKLLLKKKYRLSFDFGGAEVAWTCGLRTASANSFVGSITMQNQGHYSLTLNLDTVTEDVYISWARTGNSTNSFDVTVSNIQLELGTTETDYEPFEESTLSIPLDEFPNGMDGINDVHDEKSETGYVKAIGEIILNGNEPWKQKDSSGNCWMDFNSTPIVADYRETMMATVDVATSRTAMTANSICGYNQLSSSANYLYFRTADDEQTAENVIAYLQAHPVTLKYVLKVPIENYGLVDLGTLNWHTGGTNTSGIVRMESNDLRSVIKKPSGSNVIANVLCNIYMTRTADHTYTKNAGISVNTAGDILVYDSNYNTSDKVSAFKQAMSGVYLLYEKENPQDFTNAEMRYPAYAGGTEQILPENSSIPTTAPIVADIEYSYDFKAVDRIIGMLNSVAQNETSPSTHNYSVGDYLVYNYQLYKVIASISTGASLTVGTNIQATTIMNELASLS